MDWCLPAKPVPDAIDSPYDEDEEDEDDEDEVVVVVADTNAQRGEANEPTFSNHERWFVPLFTTRSRQPCE